MIVAGMNARHQSPSTNHQMLKVEAHNLTKRFKIYSAPTARLAEWLSFGALVRHRPFTALEEISFEVNAGEFFGVIGANGSGKSTLLKMLTGVLGPTSGTYRIDGRVTSLLELGTGFNPDLSGRDNIVNSGRLLGFDDGYMRARMDRMIDFADLAEHIEVPVKYYSSGMVVRLAFAMFAHVEPDVFIVDEALSVGDVAFAQKCFGRLDHMRAAGCTLLFASHDLPAIRKYCDQVLYLDHGRCRYLGDPLAATDLYLEAMSPGGRARDLGPQAVGQGGDHPPRPALTKELQAVFDDQSFETVFQSARARIGSGEIRVLAVKIMGDDGRGHASFTTRQHLHVHILADVNQHVPRGTFSIQFCNRMGVVVWGTSHYRLHNQPTEFRPGLVHAMFHVEPGLGVDRYTVDIGFGDASGQAHVFDRLTGAAVVEIIPAPPVDFVGLARIPCQSEITAFPKDST